MPEEYKAGYQQGRSDTIDEILAGVLDLQRMDVDSGLRHGLSLIAAILRGMKDGNQG